MPPLPTRVLGGITVPDTPLITKALEFAKVNIDPITYNHAVRSWLLGQYIADNVPSLKDRDVEVHALSAILHDLGWAPPTSPLISVDKRFEVDGANATRDFIQREGNAVEWDKHRIQLAWDSVAMHTMRSIAMHKEVEVQAVVLGVAADFVGPEAAYGGVLTREVWDGVKKEFPREGLKEVSKKICCALCKIKPETTYDNFVGDFGEAYVEGYSKMGHRIIDVIARTEE